MITLTGRPFVKSLFYLLVLVISGCIMASSKDELLVDPHQDNIIDSSKEIPINEQTFICLKKMHPVRGFFVDNLLGGLDDTIAAANQPDGAFYPPGSVVQLIPTEVMIKHNKGWSKKTNDWEFFELIVSEQGSKIKVRGTTQVFNKFGGNCLDCHLQAEPQWDFICEDNHGCEPLPIPDFLIRWTQEGDPRCP
ncbi:MAG: hypothetical protein IME94_03805 [Proteobacteria bacterium]|nr:hypothetical protein [Pseudomonadota bacterium]